MQSNSTELKCRIYDAIVRILQVCNIFILYFAFKTENLTEINFIIL